MIQIARPLVRRLPRLGLVLGLLILATHTITARAEPRLKSVTMQLDWNLNVQFAGILLAQHRGYYKDVGLDVTILPVDKEMKVTERVTAHTNWVGCSESGVLINARAEGQPVKAFGTMFQGSPFCLMSLKEKGITQPSDLIGKTLGVHPDARKALEIVLAYSRVDQTQIRRVEIEQSTAPLITGQVDVLMGYMIDEVVALETAGHALNVIPGYEHGYVAYSQVYFTSEAFLRNDPTTVQKFLAASNRGWRTAFSDIRGAAKFIVNTYMPGANLTYQIKSLEKIAAISTRETGRKRLGMMSPERWQEMCRMFDESKAIKKSVTATEMTDFSVLDALYPKRTQK